MTGRGFREGSRRIWLDICLGIALFCLVGELIIAILPVQTFPTGLAFLIGCMMSAGSMTHITYVTELVMDMNNQREAEKQTVIGYLLRMAVMTIVILIVYFTKYLNVAALFIGLFGIKAGAYLQPLMHRFLEWVMSRR